MRHQILPKYHFWPALNMDVLVLAVFSSSTMTCVPFHVVTPWMMATYVISNVLLSSHMSSRSAPLSISTLAISPIRSTLPSEALKFLFILGLVIVIFILTLPLRVSTLCNTHYPISALPWLYIFHPNLSGRPINHPLTQSFSHANQAHYFGFSCTSCVKTKKIIAVRVRPLQSPFLAPDGLKPDDMKNWLLKDMHM